MSRYSIKADIFYKLMFKKIIDHSQAHHPHAEYIQSFGISCLDKIKNIETKFNQVE